MIDLKKKLPHLPQLQHVQCEAVDLLKFFRSGPI